MVMVRVALGSWVSVRVRVGIGLRLGLLWSDDCRTSPPHSYISESVSSRLAELTNPVTVANGKFCMDRETNFLNRAWFRMFAFYLFKCSQ